MASTWVLSWPMSPWLNALAAFTSASRPPPDQSTHYMAHLHFNSSRRVQWGCLDSRGTKMIKECCVGINAILCRPTSDMHNCLGRIWGQRSKVARHFSTTCGDAACAVVDSYCGNSGRQCIGKRAIKHVRIARIAG